LTRDWNAEGREEVVGCKEAWRIRGSGMEQQLATALHVEESDHDMQSRGVDEE